MEDQRFDALVKAVASGKNRRSLLKGMLGLGAAAVVGTTVRESEVDAARRPTPTPKPITCPGNQTWNGSQCVCPSGLDKCGPDCCNTGGSGADYSECCDNACCFGHCYGEELCCAYPRDWCEVSGECCPEGWSCCPDYGCIAPDQCCTASDCAVDTCYAPICTENHYCDSVRDCNYGGAGECCGIGESCLGSGECICECDDNPAYRIGTGAEVCVSSDYTCDFGPCISDEDCQRLSGMNLLCVQDSHCGEDRLFHCHPPCN